MTPDEFTTPSKARWKVVEKDNAVVGLLEVPGLGVLVLRGNPDEDYHGVSLITKDELWGQ